MLFSSFFSHIDPVRGHWFPRLLWPWTVQCAQWPGQRRWAQGGTGKDMAQIIIDRFKGFNADLMGFNADLMGFNGDLMEFNGIIHR